MDIKKVVLLEPDETQKKMGGQPCFSVTTSDGEMATIVPIDPTNRHYHEIAEWYKKKKIKPFKFKFE